jgi:hypothetical protein
LRDSKYGVPDVLRKTIEIKEVFKNHFVGPPLLPIGEKVLVATIDPGPGSRYKKVNVYCTAFPAKLFEVEGVSRYQNLKDFYVEVDDSARLDRSYKLAWDLAGEMLDA